MNDFQSECPLCNGKEIPTGVVTRQDDGKLAFELKCIDCGSTGMTWSEGWEEKLMAFLKS